MRFALFGLLLAATITLVLASGAAAPARAASGSPRREMPAADGARPAPVFVGFHGHFGFSSRSGFGSRLRSRYGYGYGYGYGRRPGSLLHRAVRTAAWLYVLHLFFTHGGLSILLWIIIIGLVLSLTRRRRRYDRRARSLWP